MGEGRKKHTHSHHGQPHCCQTEVMAKTTGKLNLYKDNNMNRLEELCQPEHETQTLRDCSMAETATLTTT